MHGTPSAELIAPEDLASLEESLAVLSEPETMQRLAESEAQRVTERRDRYELVITPTARRQLAEHLPEAVAFAAHEFITGALLDNPHRTGKRLQPPLEDRQSARRGTYRVIYRIDDEQHAGPSSCRPPPRCLPRTRLTSPAASSGRSHADIAHGRDVLRGSR